MDALRKAEESKRQAAQKQQEDKQQEAPPIASEPSAVDDLRALEESLEVDGEVTFDLGTPEEPAQATGGLADVDIPFDFDIDENFAVEEEPSKKQADSQSKSSDSKSSEANLSTAATADISDETEVEPEDEDLDYLKPDELSRFTSPKKSSSDVIEEVETLESEITEADTELEPKVAAISSNSGLTLEARAPNIERPSIIDDGIEIPKEPAAVQASELPALETPEVAAEPIRASRNDDTATDTVAAVSSGAAPKLAKEASPKFEEESRKRESARAVFNAKHKGKATGTRTKLIAAAAVIALFPLAGGGYLLLESMGIFSPGNQYNIPPDFNANAEVYVAPAETETIADSELPDISSEPIVASGIEQEAVAAEFAAPVEDIAPNSASELNVATSADPVSIEPEPIAPQLAEQSAMPMESVVEVAPSLDTSNALAEAQTEIEAEVEVPAAINITRTDNAERVDPQLTQAYASYRGNDFIGARARYQQVLRDKPNNRDAMLGLAAVAMQLGDAPNARETYVKLLELDPRDVHARVGLLETMPASDPVMLESELRALFAAHPEVSQLAFALGNLFASQRRWSDAQQSYYDALLAAKAGGSGPISPDYAFNLAVSLERLNQLRPAYTFYREALEQSEHVSPGFDIRVLRERLDAIERVLP